MAQHFRPIQKELTIPQRTLRRMLTILPVLVVAVICYSVTVYAWFQASIGNSGNVIQATTYDVEVTITDDDGKEIEAAVDGSYVLESDTVYTVILTAAGGGEKGGYCVIQPKNGEPLYTAPIAPGKSLSFTLIPDKTQSYIFTAAWGKFTGGNQTIKDGDVIGTKPSVPANGQVTPPKDTESNESAGTTVPEQPTTSQPTESGSNPAGTSTTQPPTSDSTSEPSSAVTSAQEISAPDTTSSQTTDTETDFPDVSEPSGSESIQTGGASYDNSAGE